MTTDQTLLPCPFCGSDANLDKYQNPFTNSFFDLVVCGNEQCGIEGKCVYARGDGSSERQAVEHWNTRATVPAPIPGVQEAMDALNLIDKNGPWDKSYPRRKAFETIKAALIAAGAKDDTGIGSPVMYTDGEMSREVE